MKNGFTIVELVIVIAVIAILAAVLIPTFTSVAERAVRVTEESFLKEVVTALQIVLQSHPEIKRVNLTITDGKLCILPYLTDAAATEAFCEEVRGYVAYDEQEFVFYNEERLDTAVRYDNNTGRFVLSFDSVK